MRIGIVAPEFPPALGGMQTYAFEFARELGRRRHEVHVFTRAGQGQPLEAFPGQVHPVLRESRKLDWARLRTFRMDAWHVMNACYAWLALETRPVVVTVHGNDFLRPYLPVERLHLERLPLLWRSERLVAWLEQRIGSALTRRSVRRGLRCAARILTNSRYTEAVLLERYPACRGLTTAAMVGVSTEYLNQAQRTRRGSIPQLITVARLEERRKNVDVVLRALATLKDDFTFFYTVVGDGHLRPQLEALAAELGLQDRVRFTGFLPGSGVRELLGKATLFVLTSSINPGSHEGFGIAYLEANACGTPVLAARLAGAVEAVEEGVTGLFVDAPTPEAVAARLREVLAGRATFDSDACRRFAHRFQWQDVVDCAMPWYAAADGAATAQLVPS